MGNSKHDRIAERVAKRVGGEYNPDRGADVAGGGQVTEVEVDPGKLKEGIRQLQGYKQPRYLAVPNELVPEAKEATRGTQIGVRTETGRIVKPARRPGGR
jgi:hypothetical protein